MPKVSKSSHGPQRRKFLKQITATAAVAVAGRTSGMEADGEKGTPAGKDNVKALPQMTIAGQSISRLVCGANCFNAGSHLSGFVNREMRAYYTPEQVTKTLLACQAAGLTCWQGSAGDSKKHQRFVEAGGKMRFIAIAAREKDFQSLKKAGCFAVAHHGEVTDQWFKGGKKSFERLGDNLKKIRDAGLAVGVSTHMPDVVDAVESKGWEIDYFMTCVYERHRNAKDLKELLGHVPIPVGEVYLEEDPPRMFKAVRQTKRPCLAFKILAAGRLSEHPRIVEGAFRDTFAAIKPTDGVIVGIYDRYSNQPAECAGFVRKHAKQA